MPRAGVQGAPGKDRASLREGRHPTTCAPQGAVGVGAPSARHIGVPECVHSLDLRLKLRPNCHGLDQPHVTWGLGREAHSRPHPDPDWQALNQVPIPPGGPRGLLQLEPRAQQTPLHSCCRPACKNQGGELGRGQWSGESRQQVGDGQDSAGADRQPPWSPCSPDGVPRAISALHGPV